MNQLQLVNLACNNQTSDYLHNMIRSLYKLKTKNKIQLADRCLPVPQGGSQTHNLKATEKESMKEVVNIMHY